MTSDRIPLVDLSWQHRQVADEVRHGWADVLEDTAFIGGTHVEQFEQTFAAYLSMPHCVGVANGTDALEIALRAAGVGAGDVVLVPAHTFVASAFAVLRCGAVPRLADVSDDTLLIDPERLDVSGCRAVLPVHLYGQLADMTAVLHLAGERPVVEDGAQSQGARRGGLPMGALGTACATSFYPGKNLGAYGDAGAVLCHDYALATRIRRIANHGSETRYEHTEFGVNSRLDALQAVVLSAKLQRLETWNGLRREAAARYDERLGDLEQVQRLAIPPDSLPAWHLYPVRVPRRDDVLARLRSMGIEAAIHYPTPLHLHKALQSLGYERGRFPVAESATERLLSLPLYPGITETQQDRVVDALRTALR